MDFNSTEQNIIWFRDRYNERELVLRPPFQRQAVWSEKQKHYLIESILLGLPIPEIYIQHSVELDAESAEEHSVYAVVDGQQRIRSVLQYLGVDRDETELEFNKYRLDKLPTSSPFCGFAYSDLDASQRKAFLQYKFAVRQLSTPDDETVRNVFKRLNKYSTKLNEQELRNATYTGPFMQLSVQLADAEYWVQHRLVSPANIRRMKDVEFVSELLIGVIHGPQGGSGRAIDEYYVQYEDYEDEFPGQRAAKRRFDSTLDTVSALLENSRLERFQQNRTDFYTLFVAVAHLLMKNRLANDKLPKLRKALERFQDEIDSRLGDDAYSASDNVVQYVRAVEKGANDKKRRADRHASLLEVISPYFLAK